MSPKSYLRSHHTWEDVAGIVLGFLIGLTPWLSGEAAALAITLNAMLVGIVVLSLGAFELVSLRRWEQVGEIVCGLWLIASPFVLGYAFSGPLRFWHIALGALVAALGALELWQDWRLTDRDLDRHGSAR